MVFNVTICAKIEKEIAKDCTFVRKTQQRGQNATFPQENSAMRFTTRSFYLSFKTSPKWMFDDSRELISIRSATDMP